MQFLFDSKTPKDRAFLDAFILAGKIIKGTAPPSFLFYFHSTTREHGHVE